MTIVITQLIVSDELKYLSVLLLLVYIVALFTYLMDFVSLLKIIKQRERETEIKVHTSIVRNVHK
jgi:hypothetical protein